MKILTEQLLFNTKGNCDIVDISDIVQNTINKSGLKNGNALVFVIGSTAAITTIEYEPGLKKDMPELLEKLIPSGNHYHHNDTWGDHNGHSHLSAALIGCSKTIPFMNALLLTGTWQQIVLIDFDERKRERKVVVQLTGEE